MSWEFTPDRRRETEGRKTGGCERGWFHGRTHPVVCRGASAGKRAEAGRKALTGHGERKVGDPEQDSDVLPHLADGEIQLARDESLPGLLLVAGTRVPDVLRALASDSHDLAEPRQVLRGPTAGAVARTGQFRHERDRREQEHCASTKSEEACNAPLSPPTHCTPTVRVLHGLLSSLFKIATCRL